uniref:Very long-chain fatty acid transport protein n=1 Tax=Schmidtea mediterranea TaxID=79327 RepID=A0A0H3YF74_SCHMD|nr:slc27a-1 [Schmidtea mediterranea]
MENFIENYRWLTFTFPFSVLFMLSYYSLIVNFLLSLSIYCAFGGWKFMKILILTIPRDFRGLMSLLKVKFFVWNMIRNRHTIPDIFEKTVQRKSSHIAFLFEDEQWTFSDVDMYANKIANYLLKLGVKSGDTIALFMESRPAYVAIWMGISKIGAVPALINFNLRKESLTHCINDVKASGLICGTELHSALQEINDDISKFITFKIFIDGSLIQRKPLNGLTGSADKILDKIINMESIQNPPTTRHITRKVHDPLMFIFTSGTTGLPKAAKVTHARFVMMSYGVSQMLGIQESDIIYNPLPLYHTAGGMIGVGQVIIRGSIMAIRKKFSASAYWSDCIKYKATVVQYIGEICRYLLCQPIRPEENQHNVRLAFGNGIRPQIWVEFQTRFKIKQIGEFYGATESNANIINNVNKVGSVGFGTRILPFVYPITLIKIDPETGVALRDKNGLCIQCKPNEVGELVGKIHDKDPMRQFDGYISDAANQRKIVHDVFYKGDRAFLTGDLLIQDELGFFYFRDRLGDTFRWKGENVSTAEVEAVISNCLNLNDCVVYGVEVPHTEGKAGMATIVESGQNAIDLKLLDEKLKQKLPVYARPLFIRICRNIDTTGTFKLKKTDLMKDGFNPNLIDDNLFYLDHKTCHYASLDSAIFEQIMKGLLKF